VPTRSHSDARRHPFRNTWRLDRFMRFEFTFVEPPVVSKCQRAAFTLVELLMVILVIAILIAMFLPALQSAREAARLIQCANNMKQLGLAMHAYHSSHSQLPPGFINGHVSGCEETTVGRSGVCVYNPPEMPYMVQLFPHFEMIQAFDKIDFKYSWYDNVWANNVTGTVHAVLTCPSDGRGEYVVPTGHLLQETLPETIPSWRYHMAPPLSKSNYLAFFTGYRFDDLGRELHDPLHHNPIPSNLHTFQAAFGINRGARMAQISDGTSHTMLMGEYLTGRRHGPPNHPSKWLDARGTFWLFRPGGGILLTQVTPNSSAPDVLADPDDTVWCSDNHNEPGENIPCVVTEFCAPHIGDAHATSRSRHPGGVQVVLADGSVHFVDDSIDLGIWRGLVTIAGEEQPKDF